MRRHPHLGSAAYPGRGEPRRDPGPARRGPLRQQRPRGWVWGLLAAALFAGCGEGCAGARGDRHRFLHLVHMSDMESELLPKGEAGGVARFQSIAAGLARRHPDRTLVLAAGDTFMPGPALPVRVGGEPAVAVANRALGIQATALGNHEFDRGEAFLDDMLGLAPFPYLTATVDFRGGPLEERVVRVGEGPTPWLHDMAGKILPRGKLCVGTFRQESGTCAGFAVGVVGATTERLGMVASVVPAARSLPDLPALLGAIQREVDRLQGEGIDIVVLLSHLQGVGRELELIEAGLVGVDVIVAGGGDDRLADPEHRLLPADEPAPICAGLRGSCYPIRAVARDGAPVLVVATDGQHRYVGSLGVRFDDGGRVDSVDPASRPWPVDDVSLAALGVEADPALAALEATVQEALSPAREVVGLSRHFLNGEREDVRNRETNLGNATADSLVARAREEVPEVAFGLRNGGGIRASIGDPRHGAAEAPFPITRLDVQTSLRFNDALAVVTTTHRVLVATLEAALRGAGTARGSFPQLSAEVSLVYDPRGRDQEQEGSDRQRGLVRVAGEKLRSLTIGSETIVRDGRVLEPDRPITFVTLEYLARGGDGYFPRGLGDIQVTPLEGVREMDAFIEFLASPRWQEGNGYIHPPTEPPKRIRAMSPDSVAETQGEVGDPAVGGEQGTDLDRVAEE